MRVCAARRDAAHRRNDVCDPACTTWRRSMYSTCMFERCAATKPPVNYTERSGETCVNLSSPEIGDVSIRPH